MERELEAGFDSGFLREPEITIDPQSLVVLFGPMHRSDQNDLRWPDWLKKLLWPRRRGPNSCCGDPNAMQTNGACADPNQVYWYPRLNVAGERLSDCVPTCCDAGAFAPREPTVPAAPY